MQDLVFAQSWSELGLLVRGLNIKTVIIDPSAEGIPNTDTIGRIFTACPGVYVIGYLTPTPDNLKAVFELSKNGLREVFLHPVRRQDVRLAHALERAEGSCLGGDLIGAFETRIAKLPSTVSRVVLDVFERPHRYREARDISDEASVTSKVLYTSLIRAGLPTAKKLLIAAKVAHAYSYLRRSNRNVPGVARKLGYSDVRIFDRHIFSVFRCGSSAIGGRFSPEEAMLDLIEVLSKPSHPRSNIKSR